MIKGTLFLLLTTMQSFITITIIIVIGDIMATTVQISDTTRQKLEVLKKKEGLGSLDEVISRIADKELKTPKSMFGKAKISSWKKSDRMKFHEE